MVFCNNLKVAYTYTHNKVTILILIDGFLQSDSTNCLKVAYTCHNPYFNRWFSAMQS